MPPQTTRTLTHEDTGGTEEMRSTSLGTQGWAYLAPTMLDQAGNRIGTEVPAWTTPSAMLEMHVTTTDEGERCWAGSHPSM